MRSENCLKKCDGMTGKCEKFCGHQGFCCYGSSYLRNADCPHYAYDSLRKYKDKSHPVCVRKVFEFEILEKTPPCDFQLRV